MEGKVGWWGWVGGRVTCLLLLAAKTSCGVTPNEACTWATLTDLHSLHIPSPFYFPSFPLLLSLPSLSFLSCYICPFFSSSFLPFFLFLFPYATLPLPFDSSLFQLPLSQHVLTFVSLCASLSTPWSPSAQLSFSFLLSFSLELHLTLSLPTSSSPPLPHLATSLVSLIEKIYVSGKN